MSLSGGGKVDGLPTAPVRNRSGLVGNVSMHDVSFMKEFFTTVIISACLKIITFLFVLTGATGSIAALADVLFPSESFIAGLVEDFDSTSELLTRLRLLHPIASTILSFVLFRESRRLEENFNIRTSQIRILVIVGVTLGVLNVLININIFFSVVHLLVADLLWITYIYISMEKTRDKSITTK